LLVEVDCVAVLDELLPLELEELLPLELEELLLPQPATASAPIASVTVTRSLRRIGAER
jgi:hypothetical protein